MFTPNLPFTNYHLFEQQADFVFFQTLFQPVMPIKLTEEWKLITRHGAPPGYLT